MSEEQSFLAALRDNPADDTTRLVYADWLDERGRAEHADYLRQLAGLVVVANLATCLRQLRDAGAEFDPDWRAAVASRFEIIYAGQSENWERVALRYLARQYRTNGVEIVAVRAAPAVVADGMTLEDATQVANGWADECLREVDESWHRMMSELAVQRGAFSQYHLDAVRDSWFSVRPTGQRVPPPANRFQVVLVGRPDHAAHTSQAAALYREPLRELFDISEHDTEHLLCNCGSVSLRAGLSFSDAFARSATFNRSVKQHVMAQALRKLVSIEVRPDSVTDDESEFSP
jgi:uncharacterized protein (TIGR02996 family)